MAAVSTRGSELVTRTPDFRPRIGVGQQLAPATGHLAPTVQRRLANPLVARRLPQRHIVRRQHLVQHRCLAFRRVSHAIVPSRPPGNERPTLKDRQLPRHRGGGPTLSNVGASGKPGAVHASAAGAALDADRRGADSGTGTGGVTVGNRENLGVTGVGVEKLSLAGSVTGPTGGAGDTKRRWQVSAPQSRSLGLLDGVASRHHAGADSLLIRRLLLAVGLFLLRRFAA